MNCLQANEVVYAYQNKYQLVQALSGVSADFAQGQLYAIIGASGSGKTTFCRCWRAWMCPLLAALHGMEHPLRNWTGTLTGWSMFL